MDKFHLGSHYQLLLFLHLRRLLPDKQEIVNQVLHASLLYEGRIYQAGLLVRQVLLTHPPMTLLDEG